MSRTRSQAAAAAAAEEERLRQELARRGAELRGAEAARARLRAEGEALQREAEQLRAEGRDLAGWAGRWAQRRGGAIVSLDDQWRQALAELRRQRQELQARYQAAEAALREQLLRREAELARLGRELEALRPVQELRQEQEGHVRELQRELVAAGAQQAWRAEAARASFVRDHAALQEAAARRRDEAAGQAQALVRRGMEAEGARARAENQALRQELAALLEQARALRAHKRRLEERAQRLRRELGCVQDLARVHAAQAGEEAPLLPLRPGRGGGRVGAAR